LKAARPGLEAGLQQCVAVPAAHATDSRM
jgi:hypothetical protein